jgi:hypothetical protein
MQTPPNEDCRQAPKSTTSCPGGWANMFRLSDEMECPGGWANMFRLSDEMENIWICEAYQNRSHATCYICVIGAW